MLLLILLFKTFQAICSIVQALKMNSDEGDLCRWVCICSWSGILQLREDGKIAARKSASQSWSGYGENNFYENLVFNVDFITKGLQDEEFCTCHFICNIAVFFKNSFWSSCDKTHMVFVDFQVFTYNSRCVQADNTQCPTTIQTTEGD